MNNKIYSICNAYNKLRYSTEILTLEYNMTKNNSKLSNSGWLPLCRFCTFSVYVSYVNFASFQVLLNPI